jgi:hypothetical protein
MQVPQQKAVPGTALTRLGRRAGASVGLLLAGIAPRRGRWSRKRTPRVVSVGDRDDPRIQPGDYFCSGRSLYRVEHLCGDRVLVEDCVSGDLIDIDREVCAALERIQRAG